ncbi:transglycosylase domain-containing protein [Bilophila wadsworthia]|uniref:transglycosylase domain-containing protein n=1 Tax=Bilophila wadsworthia TaxID=35833 RepID=UPI00399D472E
MRKTIAFALVLTLLLPIAAFWGWLVLSPKPPLLDGVPFSPLVLDRDGNLLRLGLSEDEKYRVRIRLNEVAPEMVRAVLLYEDRHFYRHPGVNPLSLLRASAGMLGGARRMGGSTITMQVARLRLGLSTTTLSGKFAQMARALQYEYHYGKGEILEAYFNLAPYGGNIEGVGAAARIYFRTTSGRLTRTESLALAVVPQNPVRRSPLNGPDFGPPVPGCRCLPMPKTLRAVGRGRLLLLARRVSPWGGPCRRSGCMVRRGCRSGLRTFRARRFRCRGVGSLCAPVSTAGCSGLWRGSLPDSRHGEGVMA